MVIDHSLQDKDKVKQTMTDRQTDRKPDRQTEHPSSSRSQPNKGTEKAPWWARSAERSLTVRRPKRVPSPPRSKPPRPPKPSHDNSRSSLSHSDMSSLRETVSIKSAPVVQDVAEQSGGSSEPRPQSLTFREGDRGTNIRKL